MVGIYAEQYDMKMKQSYLRQIYLFRWRL